MFLFSLEGEEEDRDLVIAKGLGPIIEFPHWHSGWFNSHFGISWVLHLFV